MGHRIGGEMSSHIQSGRVRLLALAGLVSVASMAVLLLLFSPKSAAANPWPGVPLGGRVPGYEWIRHYSATTNTWDLYPALACPAWSEPAFYGQEVVVGGPDAGKTEIWGCASRWAAADDPDPTPTTSAANSPTPSPNASALASPSSSPTTTPTLAQSPSASTPASGSASASAATALASDSPAPLTDQGDLEGSSEAVDAEISVDGTGRTWNVVLRSNAPNETFSITARKAGSRMYKWSVNSGETGATRFRVTANLSRYTIRVRFEGQTLDYVTIK